MNKKLLVCTALMAALLTGCTSQQVSQQPQGNSSLNASVAQSSTKAAEPTKAITAKPDVETQAGKPAPQNPITAQELPPEQVETQAPETKPAQTQAPVEMEEIELPDEDETEALTEIPDGDDSDLEEMNGTEAVPDGDDSDLEEMNGQTVPAQNAGLYLLPNSDTQVLTEGDVSGMTADQLRIARNEIYARHGRIFKSADLKSWFEAQAWYKGTVSGDDFDEKVLNDIERANVKFLKEMEEKAPTGSVPAEGIPAQGADEDGDDLEEMNAGATEAVPAAAADGAEDDADLEEMNAGAAEAVPAVAADGEEEPTWVEETFVLEPAEDEGDAEEEDDLAEMNGQPAETAAAEAAVDPSKSNTYVLPDSATKKLTESDVAGLSADQLRIARNEIYARHGMKFKSEDLQAWFGAQAWYQGTVSGSDFDDSVLSETERANVKFLKEMEEKGPAAAPAETVPAVAAEEDGDDLEEMNAEVPEEVPAVAADDAEEDDGDLEEMNAGAAAAPAAELPEAPDKAKVDSYGYDADGASVLSFAIQPGSVQAKEGYYIVKATYGQGITVPAGMQEGDTVTVTANELTGETWNLTMKDGSLYSDA